MFIPLATCCCGSTVYNEREPSKIQVDGSTGVYFPTNAIAGDSNARCYFDFVNSTLYVPSNDRKKIYRTDADMTVRDIAFTLPGAYTVDRTVAAHPWASHLFYGASNGGPFELRRVNYDGTGDTSLLSISGVDGLWITVSKDEEYVFYSVAVGGGTQHLRRCNADGSNDMLIWDGTGFASIFRIAVDNVNKKLFWEASGASLTSTIYKSDFAGAGAAAILSRDTNIPPLPSTAGKNYGLHLMKWSHREERLYFCLSLSGGPYDDLGVWSSLADGSGIRKELVYPNVDTNGAAGTPAIAIASDSLHMGSAFEETGAGTLAS